MTQLQDSQLSLRLASLSKEERTRLARRVQEQRALEPRAKLAIARRSDLLSPAPLSFAQELMWLLHQMAPQRSTYHVPRAFRVVGPLDVDALRCAVQMVMSRHEVLRTTYRLIDGELRQEVASNSPLNFHFEECRDLTEADRAARLKSFLTEHSTRPFDLEHQIPLRVSILKLAADDHLVIILTHHICSDGSSKEIFYRELEACYRAASSGSIPQLPTLPIQVADYASWQRQADSTGHFEEELTFWREKLAGAPELLDLPVDHPRPAFQSFQGGRHYETFDPSVYRALKDLAKSEQTTPYTVMLAVFQTLLLRYTRQMDLVIGTPVAGRNRAEIQGLIGCFANVLVLRTQLSGDPTFRDLIRRSRTVVLDALARQSAPFEKLVVDLARKRYGSHTPLFQVLFALGNDSAENLEFPGATTTFVKVDRGIAKFDLSLGLTENAKGLTGTFEYSLDLFEADTIYRMAEHFRILMRGVAENPEARLSELPLLSPADRQQVVVDWNRSDSPKAQPNLLHQSFERFAEHAPEAVAVVSVGRRVTYGELNRRAAALAHDIRGRNLPPDTPIALFAPRSVDYALGILAILKAGAAVLPLDPAYPAERLALMLTDSRTQLLLTNYQSVPFVMDREITVIPLDASTPIPDTAFSNTHQHAGSEIAYVLYTSGSTGKPRGVLLTHTGLANETEWAASHFEISASDRVLQFASLSFDMAIEEMFCAWNRGAAVVFRDDDRAITGPDFHQWLQKEQITVMDLPTAYWHELVREASDRRLKLPDCLRLVVVGGEQAQPAVHALWRTIGGASIRWINTYGPTETSIVATAFEYPENASPKVFMRPPPIGKPIHNYKTYVLDENRQPVPIGVPGELYIGGRGVARGYLARRELTAERFLPDPFVDADGERMYRTGDQVRWLRDGNLEFLGRFDHQLKIRGFRVEPAEIESVLGHYESVCESIVIARNDPSDSAGKQLIAYVVMRAQAERNAVKLRKFLAAKLPQYMVPAHLIFLDALPLNANGKVDRRELPDPSMFAPEASDACVAPASESERIIAQIWCEELRLPQIGIHDDFFELGGESLLGARMLARINNHFDRQLSLTSLFQHPTIAQLAIEAQRSGNSSTHACIHEIRSGTRGVPLFFAHSSQGDWWPYRVLVENLASDQQVYVILPPHNGNQRQPFCSLNELASYYADRLCETYPEGPVCLAGYCFGGKLAFEIAHRLVLRGRKLASVSIIDAGFSLRQLKMNGSAFPSAVMFLARLVAWYLSELLRTKPTELSTRSWRFMRQLQRGVAKILPCRSPVSCVAKGTAQPQAESSANRHFSASVLRAASTYYPRPLPIKITLYLAELRSIFCKVRFEQGWRILAVKGLDVISVQGNHLSILADPKIKIIADRIQAELDQI